MEWKGILAPFPFFYNPILLNHLNWQTYPWYGQSYPHLVWFYHYSSLCSLSLWLPSLLWLSSSSPISLQNLESCTDFYLQFYTKTIIYTFLCHFFFPLLGYDLSMDPSTPISIQHRFDLFDDVAKRLRVAKHTVVESRGVHRSKTGLDLAGWTGGSECEILLDRNRTGKILVPFDFGPVGQEFIFFYQKNKNFFLELNIFINSIY